MASKKDLPPEVPAEQPPSPAGAPARPPKFETPAVAPPAPAARTVKPIERAPAGHSRFKIRALAGEYETRYVLAQKRADAEAHYRRAEKVPEETPLGVVALAD